MRIKSLAIILLVLTATICSKTIAYAQVFINNGGIVDARPGSYILVNGSVLNDDGLLNIDENAGINAELTVTGDITNNSVADGAGHIILYGDWINNNTFNANNGTVFFNGADQFLSGTSETQFYNLTLDGSGLKTQTINKYVTGILDLKHLELRTETHTMFVENTDINSVIRTTGFVSSLDAGSLSRQTLATNTYLFPVGSSVGVTRYRPVEIQPLNANLNTYTVRLANVEAGTEGYDRSIKEDVICTSNPSFYHRINRTEGNAAINMSIYYDETLDGVYDGIANWTNIPMWTVMTGSTTNPGMPLASADISGWNDFSETPYILYVEDFTIFAGDDISVCADNPAVNLSATFNGSGGITWSGGSGVFSPNNQTLNATYTPSAAEISAGSVTLTITANLSAGTCGAVSDEITIVILPTPNVNVVVSSQISCYGDSDGEATVNPAGTYTYEWDNNAGNQTTATATNLSEGTYQVTVTDSNGCSVVESVYIDEPALLNIDLNPINISCNGNNDGRILTTVTGGTSPYTYQWTPASAIGQNPINLGAGTYILTVTDINGCTTEQSTVITEPNPININISIVPIMCGSSLGTAVAVVHGGVGPYTYMWSNGSTVQQAINLENDYYDLTVTDSESCIAMESVYIPIQGSIAASINVINPISCYGEDDGYLMASSSNGAAPLSYVWSTSETSSGITDLGSGTYNVQITDDWGCIGNASIVLSQPQQIQIDVNIVDVTCFGVSDGIAEAIPSGGNDPYYYIWSNSQATSQINNIPAGTYSVTVTDSRSCTSEAQVNISQPEQALNAEINYADITCFGYNDGLIAAQAIGGTSPYEYTYTFGSQQINNSGVYDLPPGIYSLSILDANDCSYSANITLSEPAPLSADFFANGPSCIGNNDGFIELEVIGGTAPYIYFWDNGYSPVEYIEGLIEGSYIITVTDANECTVEVGPISLIEIEEDCIRIPNAFTPNGDGINDEWIIENIHLFPRALIKIFNRWGQVIYEAYGSDEPWDGTYNGKFVPTGSYIYIIQLFNSNTNYQGLVTIIY
jgi:gliding motility-associated-like protein